MTKREDESEKKTGTPRTPAKGVKTPSVTRRGLMTSIGVGALGAGLAGLSAKRSKHRLSRGSLPGQSPAKRPMATSGSSS